MEQTAPEPFWQRAAYGMWVLPRDQRAALALQGKNRHFMLITTDLRGIREISFHHTAREALRAGALFTEASMERSNAEQTAPALHGMEDPQNPMHQDPPEPAWRRPAHGIRTVQSGRYSAAALLNQGQGCLIVCNEPDGPERIGFHHDIPEALALARGFVLPHTEGEEFPGEAQAARELQQERNPCPSP